MTSSTTTRWSRCGRRLHQRHARHPLVRQLTSINSAIEVDLTGQVVADSIGYRMYSGWAGRWTSSAAPRSRPAAGRSSRCRRPRAPMAACPADHPGSQGGRGVVTTRAHVRTVVTEYGVAELWGKSLRERAEALIADGAPRPPRPADLRGAPAPRAVGAVGNAAFLAVPGVRRVGSSAALLDNGSEHDCSTWAPQVVATIRRQNRRLVTTCRRQVDRPRPPSDRRAALTSSRTSARGGPLAPWRRTEREASRPANYEALAVARARVRWVPGVPSGTHLTRIVGAATHPR